MRQQVKKVKVMVRRRKTKRRNQRLAVVCLREPIESLFASLSNSLIIKPL